MRDVEPLVACMGRLSAAIEPEFNRLRKKPLLGGVFGHSGFVIASYWYTDGGLDEVRYMVLSEGGLFFGMGATKAEAISLARNVIRKLGKRLDTLLAEYRAKQEAKEAEERKRVREAEEELAVIRRKGRERVSSIPKRRRQIFEESQGKCHYCGTALTLDGKWHIEHKHPRALGGGNEPGNLVASCVPCNMKKRDRTDQEFIAMRAKEAAA